MLRMFGPFAAQARWEIPDRCVKVGVRVAAFEQFDNVLPQLRVGLHGESPSFY
jgi:hypothetical protein